MNTGFFHISGIFFLLLYTFSLCGQEQELAFSFDGEYSVKYHVFLKTGKDSLPQFYYSEIYTPVCEDGICKPVEIGMKWDLTGNFLDFYPDPDNPLTKFDHREFEEEDYEKLRTILRNSQSILGIYKVSDLVDEESGMISDTLDVVTGATLKTVKNSVVEGALYTTHKLWSIANGEIPQKIREHSAKMLNDPLLQKMLLSDNYSYRYFALDHMKEEKFEEFFDIIFSYIKTSDVFIARHALSYMPDELLNDTIITQKLISVLPGIHYTLQNIILKQIKNKSLSRTGTVMLVQYLADFSREQVKLVEGIILNNTDNLSSSSEEVLRNLLSSDRVWLSETAHNILENMSGSGPSDPEVFK